MLHSCVQECFILTFGVLESGEKLLLMTGCRRTSPMMVYGILCSVKTEQEGMSFGQHCWRRHMPSQSAARFFCLLLIT